MRENVMLYALLPLVLHLLYAPFLVHGFPPQHRNADTGKESTIKTLQSGLAATENHTPQQRKITDFKLTLRPLITFA